MRRAVLPALALLLPIASAPAAPAPDKLLAQIEQCLSRLDGADEDATVGSECSGTAAAIDASAWLPALPVDSASELTLDELESLRTLTAPYGGERHAGRTPNTATLDDVLKALEPERIAKELTFWQKLGRWLREHLDLSFETPAFVKRLADWLAPYGQPVGRAIGWTVMAAIVALSIAAIVTTVLAMQRSRRGRKTSGAPSREPDGQPPAPREPSLDELAAMSPEAALRGLLALVLSTLHRRRRLPAYRALTARQVGHVALVASDDQRAVLDLIARSAERVTFGSWHPAAAESSALIASAGALLAGLPEVAAAAP